MSVRARIRRLRRRPEADLGDPRDDATDASHDWRVDVGIPVFRRPRYVTQAIEAVLAQTLSSWRLRVAEDGPGGGEVQAAVEPYLSDPRITFEARGRRVGAAENLTGLIRAATAPYVAILHDDDRWDPEFLARRVSFLDEHEDCGFVFSAHYDIDAAGAPRDAKRLCSSTTASSRGRR